jgi:hypothetical protein
MRSPNGDPLPRKPVGRDSKAKGAHKEKGSGWATFAGTIWSPEHSALIYGPERLKHLPDIFICLLLP